MLRHNFLPFACVLFTVIKPTSPSGGFTSSVLLDSNSERSTDSWKQQSSSLTPMLPPKNKQLLEQDFERNMSRHWQGDCR